MDTEAPHDARAVVDNTRITELNAQDDPSTVEVDDHWRSPHATMPQAQLGDWFKRPVKLFNFEIAEGAGVIKDVDPWKMYLNHPTITPKLEGYRLWRGKLKIKVLINGSPYQYCPIIMSYKPLTEPDPFGEPKEDETGDFSGGCAPRYFDYQGDSRFLEMVHLSLRPHIMVYPHTCQGGEMEFPFVYPFDWQVFPYPGVSSPYPTLRALNMGKLSVRSLHPLRSCSSSAAPPVTVTVFGWMEDLELTCPTVGTFVPESMFGNTPAQVVSNISNRVAEASWVPSMMRTGARAVGAIADVASMLGFTKHAVVKDATPMRIGGNMNLATTGVSVPHDVLAIEAGNNLMVDPALAGPTHEDEMMIPNVCARPCLTYKFQWHETSAPDEILAQGPVTPENYLVKSITGFSGEPYNQVVMTNTAHASSMFKYWRGPITYTFQVISTAFHKGRLYITWEPDVSSNGFSTTYQRTEVLDISESDRLTFTVDYAKPEAWSRLDPSVIRDTTASISTWESGASVPNYKDGVYCNGKLTVRVMNGLMSPVASAPVTILVWVSAPGIEFAMPWEPGTTGHGFEQDANALTFGDPFSIQSYEPSGAAVAAKVGGEETSLGARTHTSDNGVYMGEQVLSFRSLCQRTNRLLSFKVPDILRNSSGQCMYAAMPRFPFPLALGADGSLVATGVPKYNFAGYSRIRRIGGGLNQDTSSFNNNLPYHFIASCYVGMRGAVEYRVEVENNFYESQAPTIGRHQRSNVTTVNNPVVYKDPSVPLTVDAGASGLSRGNGLEGLVTTKLPMYSALKFLSPNMTKGMQDNNSDWMYMQIPQSSTSGTTSTTTPAIVYFNTSDDFSLGWYLNPPVVYASWTPYEAVIP